VPPHLVLASAVTLNGGGAGDPVADAVGDVPGELLADGVPAGPGAATVVSTGPAVVGGGLGTAWSPRMPAWWRVRLAWPRGGRPGADGRGRRFAGVQQALDRTDPVRPPSGVRLHTGIAAAVGVEAAAAEDGLVARHDLDRGGAFVRVHPDGLL
jgi:hypothetical protein